MTAMGEAQGRGESLRSPEKDPPRTAHLGQVRVPAALFRPQLYREELSKTHESLFQGDLGRTALGSLFWPILRLGTACEA